MTLEEKRKLAAWVKAKVAEAVELAIAEHERSRHKPTSGKRWSPPTLDEMKAYQDENPELAELDIADLYKGYADGGWVDTEGKAVRNWKLKLRTLAKYPTPGKTGKGKTKLFPIQGKVCSVRGCKMPAVYKAGGEYDHYFCSTHMPAKVKELYE